MSTALILLSFLYAHESEKKKEHEDVKITESENESENESESESEKENENEDEDKKTIKKEKRKLPDSALRDRENFEDYFLEDPFFRLQALNIPIIKDHQLFATLYIRLEGEATSRNILFKLRPLLPYIMDQVFVDLYHLLAVFWLPEKPLTSNDIIPCAKDAIEKIIGKNTVKKVLTRDFYIQYY